MTASLYDAMVTMATPPDPAFRNATAAVGREGVGGTPPPPGDYSCFLTDSSEDVVFAHKMFLFVGLFFIIIGLVGNTLSVAVFTGRDMRGFSSNVYLLVLAVSDSVYLSSVFLAKILKDFKCFCFPDSNGIDLIDNHDSLCKLFQYLQDLCSDYSTCVILAFTVERCVAVYMPIKFKALCTVRRARISCLIIFLFIAVFIAPYHVLMMGRLPDYNVCTIIPAYANQFSTLYVVEALLFRIIPVCFITVLNIFIIVKVTNMAKEARRRKLRYGMGASAAAAAAAAAAKGNGSGGNGGSSSTHAHHKRNRKEEKNLQLTIMLVLVSTSYVLLYIPVLVHFILQKFEQTHEIDISPRALSISQNYTSLLYVSGFAINFFLYTVSGEIFREQLKLLLCCKCFSKEHKNGYVTAATNQTCADDV